MESLKSITDAHIFLVRVIEDIRDGVKDTIDAINDSVKEIMDTFKSKLEELNVKVHMVMKATRSSNMNSADGRD